MTNISKPRTNDETVTLYWISGSPPAWRVMLALLLKQTPYQSRQLDHTNRENRLPEYLKINPTGQVPTLVHGENIIRESIAILAYIDRAFPGPALFGQTLAEVACIWQTVIDFENNFRPAVTSIAQILLRGQTKDRKVEFDHAEKQLFGWLERLENTLARSRWICGDTPSSADCWLYPSVAWIERAAAVSKPSADKNFLYLFNDFKNLFAWRQQMEGLAGFDKTRPPHWK